MYFVFYLFSKCILYFNYIFQCNLYLKYNLGQTENKSNLPAMNGCTICFDISTTGCTYCFWHTVRTTIPVNKMRRKYRELCLMHFNSRTRYLRQRIKFSRNHDLMRTIEIRDQNSYTLISRLFPGDFHYRKNYAISKILLDKTDAFQVLSRWNTCTEKTVVTTSQARSINTRQ